MPLGILDLPAPIRSRIWTHVLLSSLPQPQTISELHDNDVREKIQRTFRLSSNSNEAAIERIIKYPFNVYLPFHGSLRAHPQIRREMKACMQTIKGKRKLLHYRLDLAIEDEMQILPNWLKCPVKSTDVYRLEMDFRFFGFVDDTGFTTREGLQQRARERCRTLGFAIVALIHRFIEHGPRFGRTREGEVRIHSVMLNFHSRPEIPHLQQTQLQMELQRANSLDEEEEEEVGLLDQLEISPANTRADELEEKHDSVYDDEEEYGKPASERMTLSASSSRSSSEVVHAADLLRTVDLVLRPLCREAQYTHERRTRHFSANHLACLRTNVEKIYLMLDGILQKPIYVKNR